jgi:hypothetical protein
MTFGLKCRIIEVFLNKKKVYFNVNGRFVYAMKIRKYERTILSKK